MLSHTFEILLTFYGCVAVWLDNNPELTCHHTVEQYQRSLWVNYWLQVHFFLTGFNQVACIMTDS